MSNASRRLSGYVVTPQPREFSAGPEPARRVDAFRILSTIPGAGPALATVRAALADGGAVESSDAPTAVVLHELPADVLGSDVAQGGYLLDTTESDIVLAAHDASGLWNAAQTLRQLVRRGERVAMVPRVRVRDWPALPMRGVIEGFYGPAWSFDDHRGILEFCGAHRLNVFVYAPKGDPYHRERWRDRYPARELTELTELVEVAHKNCVDFVYAISPGLSVRHTSEEDFAALGRKVAQLGSCGVDGFWLLFDDIDPQLRDRSDVERFGGELSPLAAAQAHLANRFQREIYDSSSFRQRFVVVPVEYAGTNRSPYRQCLAQRLNRDIPVCWTGPDVVCRTISADDVASAAACFGRELVVWDNYPTNDFDPGRIFLGPLTGRDRATCAPPVVGFVANAMVQAGPSRLPLVSIADFTWNPGAYDPEDAGQRALADRGGDAAGELAVFADACGSSLTDNRVAADLEDLSEAFWADYDGSPPPAAWKALRTCFDSFVSAANGVRSRVPDKEFTMQSEPWLRTLELSGRAGSAALLALDALARGNTETAWRESDTFGRCRAALAARSPAVLRDVVDAFLREAAGTLDLVRLRSVQADENSVELLVTVTSGNAAIDSVDVWNGNVRLCRLPGAAALSWCWHLPPEGVHELTAGATRADGLTAFSAPCRVTVGTVPSALILVDDDRAVERSRRPPTW